MRRVAAWRWLGQTTSGRIFAATATITALTIVVKAGTAVRELLVAWYFGASDPVDAYVIAFTAPYFLTTVIAGSLPPVLIPAYVRLRDHEGARAAETFLSSAVVLTTAVLLPLSLLLGIGAGTYLPLLGGGFSPQKLDLARQLGLVLAPTLLTSTLIAVLASALNANNRFVVPALSPLVTTAVAIVALVLAGQTFGIGALAIGVLVGTATETAVLLGALRGAQVPIRLPMHGLSPHLPEVARPFLHSLAGSLLMAGTLLVDQAMTALLQPGSVASLNYATRLVTLPLGLVAAALGTVVLPYFSTMVSRHAWTDIRETLRYYLRLVFVIGTPVAVGLVVVADPLVRVLLSHGAFSPDDVPVVSRTVAALAVQIPFYAGVILLMRLAAALRLNAAIAVVSGVNLALNVGLNYWLSPVMGVAGIALSTSLVYVCAFTLLLLVVRRGLASGAEAAPAAL